jgi:hypothetical protein
MKSTTLYRTLTAITALALASSAPAADKPREAKPSEEEMMKRWEAATTPGAAHKALEPLVGDWSIESKMWMSPDAPPMETKATTKTRWILGGRFVQDDFTGEFMGKPMQGLGITGYDNLRQKYTGIWMDSGGTAIFISEGTVSADGKLFTFTGKSDDPMTGEKDKPLKFTIQIVNHDKHVFEMFDLSGGKSTKMMQMTYTRK